MMEVVEMVEVVFAQIQSCEMTKKDHDITTKPSIIVPFAQNSVWIYNNYVIHAADLQRGMLKAHSFDVNIPHSVLMR